MHFTRTLSVKRHPSGDHYVLSIPRQVAETLNLREDDGGLVSVAPLKKGKFEVTLTPEGNHAV